MPADIHDIETRLWAAADVVRPVLLKAYENTQEITKAAELREMIEDSPV